MTKEEKEKRREAAKVKRQQRMKFYKENKFKSKKAYIESYGKEKYRTTAMIMFSEYAESDTQFAEDFYCRKYKIMPSCYKAMKEDVVKNNWASMKTIEKAKAKSIENQKLHSVEEGGVKTTGQSSVTKYGDLLNNSRIMKHRYKEMTEEERIKDIAEIFATTSTIISKEELASTAGYTEKELDEMILKAIIYNIISDDYADKIQIRCISNSESIKREEVVKFFYGLFELRRANERNITFI